MSKAEALRSCEVFRELSDREFSSIGRLAREESLEAGATLYVQGMEAECLYILIEGRIKVSKMLWEGREETLCFIGAGESFGELALLDPGPRASGASAAEKTRLAVLYREDFLELAEKDPALGFKIVSGLVRLLGEKYRDAERSYAALARRLLDGSPSAAEAAPAEATAPPEPEAEAPAPRPVQAHKPSGALTGGKPAPTGARQVQRPTATGATRPAPTGKPSPTAKPAASRPSSAGSPAAKTPAGARPVPGGKPVPAGAKPRPAATTAGGQPVPGTRPVQGGKPSPGARPAPGGKPVARPGASQEGRKPPEKKPAPAVKRPVATKPSSGSGGGGQKG